MFLKISEGLSVGSGLDIFIMAPEIIVRTNGSKLTSDFFLSVNNIYTNHYMETVL